jgi:hypothetical protein
MINEPADIFENFDLPYEAVRVPRVWDVYTPLAYTDPRFGLTEPEGEVRYIMKAEWIGLICNRSTHMREFCLPFYAKTWRSNQHDRDHIWANAKRARSFSTDYFMFHSHDPEGLLKDGDVIWMSGGNRIIKVDENGNILKIDNRHPEMLRQGRFVEGRFFKHRTLGIGNDDPSCTSNIESLDLVEVYDQTLEEDGAIFHRLVGWSFVPSKWFAERWRAWTFGEGGKKLEREFELAFVDNGDAQNILERIKSQQ